MQPHFSRATYSFDFELDFDVLFIMEVITWSSVSDRGVLYKVSGVAQVHWHPTAEDELHL